MNTLDLFLKNAGGEHVEAVHQRILWWLFHSKTIVQEVFGENISDPEVSMETLNKTYDLQIDSNDKELLLIELKMWSTLTDKQIKKQVDNRGNGKLVYILFGYSYLEWKDFLEKSGHTVIGANDLSEGLMKLSGKTNSIFTELNNEKIGECTSGELKEFLITYALRISQTNDWFLNEAWKPKFSHLKTAHFSSLFNKVKDRIDDDKEGYIYKTGTSSVQFEITSKETGDRKLSLNGFSGKLLFWLKDKNLQFFFELDDNHVDKKSGATALEIRKKFNVLLIHEKKNQGNNTLQELKKTPKYICLMSRKYEKTEPDEITQIIKDWFKVYLNIYKKAKNN